MTISTHADNTNYFKDMAENHLAINHTEENPAFFRMNIEEILSVERSLQVSPAVILENQDGEIVDEVSDNVRDRVNIALMVIFRVKSDSFSEQENSYDASKAIIKDFIAKIRKDRMEGTVRAGMGRVTYSTVSNILDGFYGTRAVLSFDTSAGITYDKTKWRY